jgi:hypothetical protein
MIEGVFLDLAHEWRTDADALERRGDSRGAAMLRDLAGEVVEACGRWERQELTIGEASEQSGYSERRLRELLADGTIPNAGRKHAPRIRRGDLPLKPTRAASTDYDPQADAQDLLGRMREPRLTLPPEDQP